MSEGLKNESSHNDFVGSEKISFNQLIFSQITQKLFSS